MGVDGTSTAATTHIGGQMKRALAILTRSTAALALAAGGVIAFGAGPARADTLDCSAQEWSNYDTEYTVCVDYTTYGHATVTWAVNTRYAKTDERFYLQINDSCDSGHYNNWNDETQSSQNVGQMSIGCPSGESLVVDAQLWPTESGNHSGPVADD
jgi:hypothetical protein